MEISILNDNIGQVQTSSMEEAKYLSQGRKLPRPEKQLRGYLDDMDGKTAKSCYKFMQEGYILRDPKLQPSSPDSLLRAFATVNSRASPFEHHQQLVEFYADPKNMGAERPQQALAREKKRIKRSDGEKPKATDWAKYLPKPGLE